jgi:hypothetical protein
MEEMNILLCNIILYPKMCIYLNKICTNGMLCKLVGVVTWGVIELVTR